MRRIAWSPLGSVAVALLAACTPPDDTLFTPAVVEPQEVQPGLFRVTWNPGPDVVRGFNLDGTRIVFRSQDLGASAVDWRLHSVPVAGGQGREEAAIYRLALINPVGQIVFTPGFRWLALWRQATPGAETCRGCPPAPTAVQLSLMRLGETDGLPLSALPVRFHVLPNFASASPCDHRIRINPAEREIRDRGTNPFGPVVSATGSDGYYSDGETTWRFDPADPAQPADSIGPGSFPDLSRDGSLLAVAQPVQTDSVSDICIDGICPCIQETVSITAGQWQVVIHDLRAGTTRVLAPGLEPRFDPRGRRVLVRRFDGLYWVDLESGAADSIPGTTVGFAPAISPDGSLIAFSSFLAGNVDVFFVRVPAQN
ncbi:MAG TPA: hypothetical protein VGA37_13425 [Gemmatimonadales bacterium]